MTACPDMYELLDNKDRNSVQAAAESGRLEAFEFLKARLEFDEWSIKYEARPEFGSLINKQDEEGNTPMYLAAINGHYKIVDKLKHCKATLIVTVTFTEAFTVPSGFNQNESENGDDGLAVLRKRTAFSRFLIANTLAFGLSTSSVFPHFFVSTTIEDTTFHKKVARRIDFYTNWSVGALLVDFIAGTYTLAPHFLGLLWPLSFVVAY
nr:hypothetical protein CFP56_65668 [Quercus suber]